jgi:hypothetical protein
MSEPRALPPARHAYAGPGCPRCGARLDPDDLLAGLQPCGACGNTFEAMPFPRPPDPPPIAVRSVLEAGPEGVAPCSLHAGNAAESACDRCGVLMCALCRTEADGASLCPGCFDRLRASAELPFFLTRFPNYAGRARALGCVGCLVYVVGILTGPFVLYYAFKAWRQKLAAGERDGLVSLVISAILGLAQIGFFVIVVVALAAAFLDMAKTT